MTNFEHWQEKHQGTTIKDYVAYFAMNRCSACPLYEGCKRTDVIQCAIDIYEYGKKDINKK